MATGDTYKLAVSSTFTGNDEIVNVFHYRQTADAGVVSNKALALINAWIDDVQPAYLACLSSRITLTILSAKGVDGSVEEAEVNSTDNGTGGSGDIVPLTGAPLISWRTGESGRRKRGRTYMPPCEEANQDAGVLVSGYINDLETLAANAFTISTSDGDDYEMVVYSPENLSATPPVVGTIITPVVAAIVRSTMGTQRRRRQGVGS